MNEFKVGLMAIMSMIAVVIMSLMVTSNQSGFGKHIKYRTIISDASGIFPKTPIKVAGINAGRITSIELQGNKALISFEVLDTVKITQNSELQIKAVGFLGDKFLEIRIGSSDKTLDENSFIESIEGGGMESLVKDASEVMKDVKVIVSSIKDSLVPPGEEAPVKVILADVQELMKNTKEVTASLKKIITGNEERMQTIIANFEEFSNQLAFQMDKEEPKSAISDIKSILTKTDLMMGDLQKVVNDMRNGKGTVGKLLVEDEIADEVRQTLAGVQKIVSKVENIRTELSVYTGVNSTAGGSETTAGLKIFPSPERFYLLGISTSEFGPEYEKITTTQIDSASESVKNEKIRSKDTYRFNIQVGRNVQDWTFRGGLIESTGGLGVDYSFSRFGTIVSAEVFDYREDIGANLRLSTDIQLWNVFFTKFQAEDVTNKAQFIFSAGLRFNDEDLKGLMGFFL